uniref:Arrestin_N domain-containing protein n=1 Tax=Steinernema glaseri TaxID=37863 RepID=A0A1I7ZAG4_9BILA
MLQQPSDEDFAFPDRVRSIAPSPLGRPLEKALFVSFYYFYLFSRRSGESLVPRARNRLAALPQSPAAAPNCHRRRDILRVLLARAPIRPLSPHQMTDVFNQFEIEFDAGEEPIFHGGELITGKLKINLTKPVTIKAIKLQFKGRACLLNRAEKDGEVEKVYFDKDFILLERPPGHLEPGHFLWNANFVYSLPFECPFPKGCPSSYESPSAFVRYYARATFDIDGHESNKYLVKRGITVVAPPEGDLSPPTAEPVSASDTVMFGGCCCRGKVTAEVSLPKRHYAPGEPVVGALKVANQHPRHVVDSLEVRLLDRVSAADGPASDLARTLLHRRLEKTDVVKSKSSLAKNDVFFFEVPALLPSSAGAPPTAQTPEIYSMAPDCLPTKVVESPSTATLKFRKQPFLRVDYVIQDALQRPVGRRRQSKQSPKELLARRGPPTST